MIATNGERKERGDREESTRERGREGDDNEREIRRL
jgi:hypothetical protein